MSYATVAKITREVYGAVLDERVRTAVCSKTMEIRGLVPTPVKYLLKFIAAIPYRGDGRWCPVCGQSSSRFAAVGYIRRQDAKCMHCGALERHRLVWLFFGRKTSLFTDPPSKMLHVAPEPIFTRLLRPRLGDAYLTADLDAADPFVDIQMDVTDIRYPDKSFDVIYCSHVLEHVPDDRKAMREFRRVLTEDGWAVLLVPITATSTYEDPTVTTSEERLRLFGQEDHVRRYGPDYVERLSEAGFDVTVIVPTDFLTAEEIERMGITPAAGEIYLCRRRTDVVTSGSSAAVSPS